MEKLYIKLDELKIEVKVIGNRTVYGRDEVEVSPVSGSGAKWITKEKVLKPADLKKTLVKHNV